MRKIIISLAPVKADAHVDSTALADDVTKCARAGASLCHLHCRLPNGALSPDYTYMANCFDAILQKSDIAVQVSTGGVSEMNIEQRCYPLDYGKTETASLNGGTINLGENVYINSLQDIRYCANACNKRGILPETEVFDISMINIMEQIRKQQPFASPMLYNLVFGHKGGMSANIESLIAFRSFVPKDALWGVTHFNRNNWTFIAAAIAMGASIVRIGFEDSDYLTDNLAATHNWQLVEKLAELIRAMGLIPANVTETRSVLKLNKR